jgi:hypothetical protein
VLTERALRAEGFTSLPECERHMAKRNQIGVGERGDVETSVSGRTARITEELPSLRSTYYLVKVGDEWKIDQKILQSR